MTPFFQSNIGRIGNKYVRKNRAQINRANIRENIKIVDYNYKVGDKGMLKNKSAYNYKTSHSGAYEITHRWTNDTDTLQVGAEAVRYNTRLIKPYKRKINVDYVHTQLYLIYLCTYIYLYDWKMLL